jgi:hypothetical protein
LILIDAARARKSDSWLHPEEKKDIRKKSWCKYA